MSEGSALVKKKNSVAQRSTRRRLKLARSSKASGRHKNKSSKSICVFFTKYGKCSKGDDCEFAHDRSKVMSSHLCR